MTRLSHQKPLKIKQDSEGRSYYLNADQEKIIRCGVERCTTVWFKPKKRITTAKYCCESCRAMAYRDRKKAKQMAKGGKTEEMPILKTTKVQPKRPVISKNKTHTITDVTAEILKDAEFRVPSIQKIYEDTARARWEQQNKPKE